MQNQSDKRHNNNQSTHKSPYRAKPVRAVFLHDLEKGKWAFVKNKIFRPITERLDTAYRTIKQYRTTHPHYFTRLWQALAVTAIVIIPITGVLNRTVPLQTVDGVEKITTNQVLTVATVPNHSIAYTTDGLMHGFGYDVARQYASHLGVPLALVHYSNDSQALQAVASGTADMALLSNGENQLNNQDEMVISPVACSDEEMAIFAKAGIDNTLSFVTTSAVDTNEHLTKFLCNGEVQEDLTYLAQFHNDTLLDNAYNAKHFQAAIKKLPLFEYGFKVSAKEFNHDWQLLAMIGYQESHLNADATSPTGVQGIMMLTQDTAKMMGVKDRNNVTQSIHGGAKYLNKLQGQFADIPEVDRLWFVLAAYNMGPNAVRDIQGKLKEQGKDPNLWLNVYAYLNKHADTNSRYGQCVTYVTNIRTYLEAIKRHNQNAQSEQTQITAKSDSK